MLRRAPASHSVWLPLQLRDSPARLPTLEKPDAYTLTPSDSEIGTSEGEKGEYLEALWQQSLSMKPDYHHVLRKDAEKKKNPNWHKGRK